MIGISLGTNQGNRILTLSKAVKLLAENEIKILRTSLIYETPALLPENAESNWNIPYFNLAVLAESKKSPKEVLFLCKKIEQILGRKAAPRWAPRIIDIDLIFHNQNYCADESLILPHPEFHKRGFVLLPLAEIAPEWRCPVDSKHPAAGRCIRELASSIELSTSFTKTLPFANTLMGIINLSPDSFSENTNFSNTKDFIKKFWQCFSEGAEIIDLGAESTRPGANSLSVVAEIERLQEPLSALAVELKNSAIRPQISLDTYHFETASWAAENFDIDIFNDVSGNSENISSLVKNSDKKIVLMHSISIPASKSQLLPLAQNTVHLVFEELEKRKNKLIQQGLKEEQIILDLGIGFGKNSFQSLELVKKLAKFKELGCELLLAHSRKSFFSAFTQLEAQERDLETAGICCATSNFAKYFRVHNVKICRRTLTAASICLEKPLHE